MVEDLAFRKFLSFLEEDIPFWDTTTEAIVPGDAKVRAKVIVKESCIVACVDDIAAFLRKLGLEVEQLAKDGDPVEGGSTLLEISGPARVVLSVERVVLNVLMHCSGVATATRRLIDALREVNSRVRVAATRKTMPGLRYFEKRAVAAGGGDTHRLSLSDAILIKDNHLRLIGDIGRAVRLAKERASFIHKVEVEVSSVEEAVEAAESGADVVMLDNMRPEDVARVLEELRRRGLRDRVIVEVSGGINYENAREYAKLDIDVMSCSFITMSSRAVDMSLEVSEVIGE